MASSIQLGPDDRIVFIGDSITDADRDHPAYAPLGRGYVHFVGNALLAKHPERNLAIVNTGVGGDTIGDMQRRWEADCLAHRPDILSVMIGVNDAWYLSTDPDIHGRAARPAEYEVTFDQLLLDAQRACDCQTVLMEPFMFCRKEANEMRRLLEPYIEAVHRLAAKHRTALVPLQKNINTQIERVAPEKWSSDLVHPYTWAHAWIAQQWLAATGL